MLLSTHDKSLAVRVGAPGACTYHQRGRGGSAGADMGTVLAPDAAGPSSASTSSSR